MALEIRQTLKLSQQLVMTPQLQQAIKLLQLNRLELANMIQQELQENPVLEESLETDEENMSLEASREEEGPEPMSEQAAESGEAAASSEAEQGGEAADVPEDHEPSDAEKFADVDWRDYIESRPQTSLASSRDDDEQRSYEAFLSKPPTLTEHLRWQIRLSVLSEEEVEIADWIIGNLDNDGYLKVGVQEIARQLGMEDEFVEATLAKVQQLDPPGVAARNLRECLLLQLPAIGMKDPLVHDVIDNHLDALQRKDFRGIARDLGVSVESVAAAAREIAHLSPKPGSSFGESDPVYITPDIYVFKLDDDFHIMLNEDGLPRLRISNMYRDVLSKGSETNSDTKEYVQNKVRSALWLIKSIHQRQRTIYKVMKSIVGFQREFFERGVQYLKPLNLRDVADDIGMHESTVSRVTTHKYAHTPQGVFELKYFFNSSIGCFEGDSIASESVKEKIRTIIANEDSRRPLSDQRISQMLKAANVDIARRTVTKYRESMNLLSSTKRRVVG